MPQTFMLQTCVERGIHMWHVACAMTDDSLIVDRV